MKYDASEDASEIYGDRRHFFMTASLTSYFENRRSRSLPFLCTCAHRLCWKPLLHIYSYCANLILSCVGDKNLCLLLLKKICSFWKKKLLWIRASKNVLGSRESHSRDTGSIFQKRKGAILRITFSFFFFQLQAKKFTSGMWLLFFDNLFLLYVDSKRFIYISLMQCSIFITLYKRCIIW